MTFNKKSSYKTHQKEVLLDYLRNNPGKHMTVSSISDYFKSQGKKIGTTTIYRNLDSLVNMGKVNKYSVGPGEPAYFEYTHEDHLNELSVLHCKCESCGILIHVDCEELITISKHLKEHHKFSLNPKRTVVLGMCKDCLLKK